MALKYASTLRDTWCNDLIAAVGVNGRLLIYSGPPPANVAAGPTGTLLSSGCRGNSSAFGSTASGVLTINGVTSDPGAVATGTAGYFRWLTAASVAVFQGTITRSGLGGDLIMTDTAIVQGDIVAISSWLLTAPGA